jgi:hypothetical protein
MTCGRGKTAGQRVDLAVLCKQGVGGFESARLRGVARVSVPGPGYGPPASLITVRI